MFWVFQQLAEHGDGAGSAVFQSDIICSMKNFWLHCKAKRIFILSYCIVSSS